jgi:hypothetical protein
MTAFIDETNYSTGWFHGHAAAKAGRPNVLGRIKTTDRPTADPYKAGYSNGYDAATATWA